MIVIIGIGSGMDFQTGSGQFAMHLRTPQGETSVEIPPQLYAQLGNIFKTAQQAPTPVAPAPSNVIPHPSIAQQPMHQPVQPAPVQPVPQAQPQPQGGYDHLRAQAQQMQFSALAPEQPPAPQPTQQDLQFQAQVDNFIRKQAASQNIDLNALSQEDIASLRAEAGHYLRSGQARVQSAPKRTPLFQEQPHSQPQQGGVLVDEDGVPSV